MQAVTIRNAKAILSPEEIRKKKAGPSRSGTASDNNAEFVDGHVEKAAQKEARENSPRSCSAVAKAEMVKVDGVPDDTYTESRVAFLPGIAISGRVTAISWKLKEGACKVNFDKEGMK